MYCVQVANLAPLRNSCGTHRTSRFQLSHHVSVFVFLTISNFSNFVASQLRQDFYDYIDVLIIVHVLCTGSQSGTTPEQLWHTSNLMVPIKPSCLSLCLTYFVRYRTSRCQISHVAFPQFQVTTS